MASGFSAKVLGHADTTHVIKISEGYAAIIGLSAKRCGPEHAAEMAVADVELERKKVAGWRLVTGAGGAAHLQQEWRARGSAEASALLGRIRAVSDAEGHPLRSALQIDDGGAGGPSRVVVDIGAGERPLTLNDFILASKVKGGEGRGHASTPRTPFTLQQGGKLKRLSPSPPPVAHRSTI